MIRRPPRSTRTDTLFPYTTLFRSGVGGLAVDRFVAGPVAQHRDADAHVQLQVRHRGQVGRERGAHLGAGHHQVWPLARVAEDLGLAAFGHVLLLDPRRVAFADDKPPLPVTALVPHRPPRAGETSDAHRVWNA